MKSAKRIEGGACNRYRAPAERIEAVLCPRRRDAERRKGALSSRRSNAEQSVAQTVIAQIGQGLRIMFFLFHTLMILQFFAYKITKKVVKNNSAKPENRSPRVQL
jgi:hypothetical protein